MIFFVNLFKHCLHVCHVSLTQFLIMVALTGHICSLYNKKILKSFLTDSIQKSAK